MLWNLKEASARVDIPKRVRKRKYAALPTISSAVSSNLLKHFQNSSRKISLFTGCLQAAHCTQAYEE